MGSVNKYCVVLTVALLLLSCRVQQLPTVERVQHRYELQLQYDSVSRDHFRFMWLAGDTIYVTDSIFVDRWRFRTDSIHLRDSIPYPVEVPVPGVMTAHQSFMYRSGWVLWIIIVCLVIYGVLKLALKIYLRK